MRSKHLNIVVPGQGSAAAQTVVEVPLVLTNEATWMLPASPL